MKLKADWSESGSVRKAARPSGVFIRRSVVVASQAAMPAYALAIAAPSTRIRAISSRWRSRTNSSTSRSQAEALITQLCLWDQRFTFPQALFRGPLRFSVRHMMVTWVRRALQERARNDGGAFLGTATRKSD